MPTLREIVGGTWKKEEELKGLKSEVAALERKIQLELVPTPTIDIPSTDRKPKHIIIGHQGLQPKDENGSKGIKM